MIEHIRSMGLSGDFEILIGSDKTCQIQFTSNEVPEIAKKHAILKRIRDRLFIQDLGSKAGTFIAGVRLPKRSWQEIVQQSHGDNIIYFGPTQVEIEAQLFRGRPRMGVETTALFYQTANKLICKGAYLRAQPKTMTAIMGPAGCGKSTFLDLINGYRKPNQGQVFVTRQQALINLHQHYAQVRQCLGYLPQDEVMIPELTVHQSLTYRLKLQFIGLAPTIREYLIQQTGQQLGFTGQRLQQFLHTVIGSLESGIRGLSGGERKRANLAHELIAMPLVLFLDEPTSGLSSVDADKIVRLLQQLTQLNELTTIATIHQPSRDTFARFDQLLLMNHEGIVVYYGATAQAVPYFEQITQTQVGDSNPAEYLLTILDNSFHHKKLLNTLHN
jgi:ABC-type multidrug transport system ATPase subunit